MLNTLLALAASAALAGCSQPPSPGLSPAAPVPSAPVPSAPAPPVTVPPETVPPAAAAPVPKAPAPGFKPGMRVLDRSGAQIGRVQTVTETPGGLNVVVEIDGKLVGVPPTTLELRGETVASSQSKAEMLANAGAPR
jgi:hypothetical protein